MIQKYAIIAGGYVLAGIMFWLFIDAKSDLATEIEACNTRSETAAREATEAVTAAQIVVYEKRLVELAQIAASEAQARHIAVEAARIAESRPDKVRTVIKEVASANACIDTAIPAAVLDSMRD